MKLSLKDFVVAEKLEAMDKPISKKLERSLSRRCDINSFKAKGTTTTLFLSLIPRNKNLLYQSFKCLKNALSWHQ